MSKTLSPNLKIEESVMEVINENDVMDAEDVISKLKDLAALEFNAIETYEAAIERLEDLDIRAKMTEFLGEHERHLMDLCDAIIQEGGAPPEAEISNRY